MPFSLKRRSNVSVADSADKGVERKSKRKALLGLLKGSWRKKEKKDEKPEAPTAITREKPIAKVTSAKDHKKEDGGVIPQTVSAAGKEQARAKTPSLAPNAAVVEQLSEDDIQNLFSGAPQFSVGSVNGQLQPSASFPWDISLKVRNVNDSPLLEHPAFSACTLRRHLPVIAEQSDYEGKALGYDIELFEVPSMLSARGNEPGTVGFDHFLQEPIADSLEPDQEHDISSQEVFDDVNNFELLQSNPEKLGIRKFDLAMVAERLAELSDVYKDASESHAVPTILIHQPSAELYTLLFGKLLTPPKFDASTEDPTGLKVQVEALTKALTIKGVWYDFGDVEWRIRLGQILWSDSLDAELSLSTIDPNDSITERNVLLLQLVLSCELLVRLDAIAALSAEEVKSELHLTAAEMAKFRESETRKSRWDLVLARRFLENVEARSMTTTKEIHPEEPAKRGFFYSTSTPQLEAVKVDHVDVMFLPRKSSQQLKGLFHFARAIAWPNSDQFESKLTETLRMSDEAFSIPSPSVYATPLSTPRSMRSARSSGYFETRPDLSREVTQRSLQLQPPSPGMTPSKMSPNGSPSVDPAVLTPKALIGGWLTRSYLTGLVLPGEAISHFLISSLLENDAAAIAALGDSANLYGGFVYKGRSWWSKGCIVGRVLTCLTGTTECMGWVSLPCVPQGFHSGWIDVQADSVESSATPRIQHGDKVAVDSSFLASNDVGEVRPADLILPRDSENIPSLSMWFDALRLETPRPSSITSDEGGHEHYTATLHFSPSSISTGLGNCSLPLQNLVQYISAYPCTPPPPEKLILLKSTKSAETENEDSIVTKTTLGAHPLHISQTFEIIPVMRILTPAFIFPPPSDSKAEDNAEEVEDGRHVFILDARSSPILELIARGWCSSHAEHALISRVGVTCLACTVREARAIGVRVVIRVG